MKKKITKISQFFANHSGLNQVREEFTIQKKDTDPMYESEDFNMAKLNELAVCVETGDITNVVALTKAALEEGNAPIDVLNVGLVEPINVLGEKFRLGQIYIPELLVSSKAMKLGVDVVKPLLVGSE